MLHLRRTSWVAAAAMVLVGMGAQAQDVSGGGFYPFRGSARTIGLAGAFTAVADDTAGLHFNPAGMAQIQTRQASFDIKVNSSGENYWRLAYVEPVASGKLGGGLSYIHASDGAGRKDRIYQLTYGQYFAQGLAVGANLRYHTVQTIGNNDEDFAFDFGALYTPPSAPNFSFGLAALDINEPSFQGIGLSKRVFNLGAAWRPDRFTVLALDWYDIGSHAKRGMVRFGAERVLSENIALRAGVAEQTFGVGISLMYRYLTLDYGFQSVDNGPDINMLSVTGNF